MKKYIENLRELRESNNLNQTQVAKILGISQQVYSRYERELNELPIRHLIRLCEFYNVSSDEVLGIKKV